MKRRIDMGLCSETKILDNEVAETLIVEVNRFGQVLSALSKDGKEIEYDEDEKWFEKTLVGSYFLSPGRCCWKKVRNKWRCREEYC
jgi:hypothetical protein